MASIPVRVGPLVRLLAAFGALSSILLVGMINFFS
jgi:hypothetical protein